jgi:hypothetical protein
MRRLSSLFLVFILLGCLGCRSEQLARDQDQFRMRLLDLYTNQIMDNLVRAEQGLPIVQLDYSSITGTITQNGTGSFTSTQTDMNSKMLVIPTVVRTLLHSFTNTVTYNPSAYQTSVLTVTANPVLNNNEVYNAYLEFINPELKPGRLVKTCEPPPPGAAHLVRRWGDEYYWIPIEFKYDFLRLALVTTVQRGQPLTVPDRFDNTVASASLVRSATVNSKVQNRFLITFEKKMKNGTGTMEATIKSVKYPIRLTFDTEPLPAGQKRPKPGEDTDRFIVIYEVGTDKGEIPASAADFKKALEGQAVKVDLDFFKPTLPSTEQLLSVINNNTQLLRIQGQTH